MHAEKSMCVKSLIFTSKIGFIFLEVFISNIHRKGHREAFLSHCTYLSLLCALYTLPVFISAVYPLLTTRIYLCCVPSIHYLCLSLLCALYTLPVFISAVCPLYITCIYLCCVPSINNPYLSLLCALY